MTWQGFVLAFSAAVSQSSIDSLRKIASQRFTTAQCVAIVALMEGSLSFAFISGQGTFDQGDAPLLENRTFLFSAFMSAALRLLSLLLYQSAIQLAPLSSTVPYLSLSPAMLLVTAYLLIGEQPSWPGLVGVVIVTLGGYLLAFSSASPNPKKSDERTPTEKVAPVIEHDDSVMSLEMGSKLLIMSDPGAKKGLTGVVAGAIKSIQQLGDNTGSVLMVLVAFLWSLISTFDKMGIAAAPTLPSYLAVQRAMTAVPCVLYLILKDIGSLRLLYTQFPLMAGLVGLELLTVILYLSSLKFLFVSYAVAAKRSGILLSVLSGWLLFGENIRDKIVYVMLMMAGMLMIVLAPDMSYNTHLRNP
eukprot:jgi/Ulvmu1/12719/UM095_0023.1